MPESAEVLRQRLQRAKAPKERQRVQALYGAACGHARHRPALAPLLGVHRHRVAAWFEADAEGGSDQLRRDEGPRPPLRPRLTATALTALPEA